MSVGWGGVMRRAVHRAQLHESGMAMLMALVVIMVLALISAALANLALSEFSTATTVDRSTQAFLAAEAGAERAIAYLRPRADWSSDTNPGGEWQLTESFPDPTSGSPSVGSFTVSVRRLAGDDPSTNLMIRSTGTVRGATRTIEFELRRLTGVDFTTYSIRTLDITQISGGGSLQFHGSAYFEGDLRLRGAAQAGFFNDRFLLNSHIPNQYLNHLYVTGELEIAQGNPTIDGLPDGYWWVHVGGAIVGSSRNFRPVNLDSIVPPPFYPDVLGETRRAFTGPGNLLAIGTGTEFVVCQRQGGGWVVQTRTDLVLGGTSEASTFFLPLATADPAGPCAGYPASIAEVRNGDDYMLMWDAQSPYPLVFRNDDLPIYIPGKVVITRDTRYEGKGTVVVAAQPTATAPGGLAAQNTCALDFGGTGSCDSTPVTNRLRARVSRCQSTPGDDVPANNFNNSTFARVNPNFSNSPDVAVFIVNGSAYANLRENSCSQEMSLVAVVGDRNSGPATPACAGAHFTIRNKLQWYGVLMTREMCLGQVPDFWQVPSLLNYLPDWSRDVFAPSTNPVQVFNWRELY